MNYFEVHYLLPKDMDKFEDVHFISEFKNKRILNYNTALKAVQKLKKSCPQAFAIEICEYDEAGRID